MLILEVQLRLVSIGGERYKEITIRYCVHLHSHTGTARFVSFTGQFHQNIRQETMYNNTKRKEHKGQRAK